jgi:hypothetical protein
MWWVAVCLFVSACAAGTGSVVSVAPSTVTALASSSSTLPSPTTTLGQVTTVGVTSLTDGHRQSAGGLSPKTVRYIHTIIHKALADAVDADLLTSNVAERAKPPRPRAALASEIGYWEPHELSAFLDSVSGHRLEAA